MRARVSMCVYVTVHDCVCEFACIVAGKHVVSCFVNVLIYLNKMWVFVFAIFVLKPFSVYT